MWRTCSHERRTRDVIREMERIAYDFQNRNEEIVTDDRQRQDQVRRNDDVDDDPALRIRFNYGFQIIKKLDRFPCSKHWHVNVN